MAKPLPKPGAKIPAHTLKPQRGVAPQPMLWALGDVLRCRLTGATGVAISVTEYLYGCRRWSLQPAATKDEAPAAWVHFDEPQLERVARALPAMPAPVTGGPRPDMAPRPTPTR